MKNSDSSSTIGQLLNLLSNLQSVLNEICFDFCSYRHIEATFLVIKRLLWQRIVILPEKPIDLRNCYTMYMYGFQF